MKLSTIAKIAAKTTVTLTIGFVSMVAIAVATHKPSASPKLSVKPSVTPSSIAFPKSSVKPSVKPSPIAVFDQSKVAGKGIKIPLNCPANIAIDATFSQDEVDQFCVVTQKVDPATVNAAIANDREFNNK